MPHILSTLDFTPVPQRDNRWQPKEFWNFAKMLRKLYEQLARVLNGLVSFGNGVTRDNIDGEWATVLDTGPNNTDFTITHNMLRIPIGFILMNQSKGGIIYQGSVPWTTTTITLKCDLVDNNSILIFIV